MGVDASDYLQEFLRLLPEGPVWSRDLDSMQTRVLKVPAEMMARIDAKAQGLIAEVDPRAAKDLLEDWERNYGLPDECTSLAATPEDRRRRLYQKVVWQGGQSKQFFVDLVESLGYPGSMVTEFRPFRANSKCNAGLNQNGWRFAWRITVPSKTTVRKFTAISPCNSPLQRWGDDTLACILSAYKPAHTILFIAYEGDYL